MSMRVLSRTLVSLGLLVAAHVAVDDAWAHVRRAEAPLTTAVTDTEPAVVSPAPALPDAVIAAGPAPASLWPLLALIPLAALAAAPPRRALGLALIALLAVFAAESAVHSVHHLADQQAATQCAVSVASAHLHGATLDAPDDGVWRP